MNTITQNKPVARNGIRHIGTDSSNDPVILLGFQAGQGMASVLRISSLKEAEKDFLRTAIIKYARSETLMKELLHETNATGNNYGQYFFNRSETMPLRDIVISDRQQCIEWTKGVSYHNTRLPVNEFIDSLASGGRTVEEAPEAASDNEMPAANPFEDVLIAQVAAPSSPAPSVMAPNGAWAPRAALAESVRDDQIDELIGVVKKACKKIADYETRVKALERVFKKAGFKIDVQDSDSE